MKTFRIPFVIFLIILNWLDNRRSNFIYPLYLKVNPFKKFLAYRSPHSL